MERHQAQFREAGLEVVAVGLGRPEHAQRYCGRLAPNIECVCSAELDAYQAFGLAQATFDGANMMKMLTGGIRATMAGQMQGAATGDTKMLGGTFIIDGQGIVRWAHYDRFPGDHADLAEALSFVMSMGWPVKGGVAEHGDL